MTPVVQTQHLLCVSTWQSYWGYLWSVLYWPNTSWVTLSGFELKTALRWSLTKEGEGIGSGTVLILPHHRVGIYKVEEDARGRVEEEE